MRGESPAEKGGLQQCQGVLDQKEGEGLGGLGAVVPLMKERTRNYKYSFFPSTSRHLG